MTAAIFTEIEEFITGLRAKYATPIKTIENEGHSIVSDAVSYIEANGLTDLEAIAANVLTSVASGTPWPTILTAVKMAGEADGKTLAAGAVSVVTAKVQADLLAAGKLTTPAV
jgi:hypothetical protein